MDERIETRAKGTDKTMVTLLEQAKTAATSASEALAQIRGADKLGVGGATPGGRCFSEAAQPGRQGLANGGYQVWVRKTLEIQGICEYGSRFASGVFSDFADDCLSRLENKLTDNATAIDWSRSRDSSRFPSNFKLALVLNSPPENMHEKHWLDTLRPNRRGAQGP